MLTLTSRVNFIKVEVQNQRHSFKILVPTFSKIQYITPMNSSPTDYVLGIDIGTGSCKGLAIDLDGQKLADSNSFYPIQSSREGYAEQNPEARDLGAVKNLPSFAIFQDGKLITSDATSKEDVVENMVVKLVNS